MNALINDEANKHFTAFCKKFVQLGNAVSHEDAITLLTSFEFFLNHSKIFINSKIDILKSVKENLNNTELPCAFLKTFFNQSTNNNPLLLEHKYDNIKQLRNKICILELEKNVLLCKLKRKEQECGRINELIECHVKLLNRVNEINKYLAYSKCSKNIGIRDASTQTKLMKIKSNKGICANTYKTDEILSSNISDFLFSMVLLTKRDKIVIKVRSNAMKRITKPEESTNSFSTRIVSDTEQKLHRLRSIMDEQQGRLFSKFVLKRITLGNIILPIINNERGIKFEILLIMMGDDKNMDLLTQRLQDTKLPSGVSFAGKGLKMNTALEAQEVVDAINSGGLIEYLNLEGNTIGVQAAEAISMALEGQPNLKRALWKDIFTGRLKQEIPKALKALCRGVMKAQAKLEILDLSDNASGPIGVDGIADFIKSPSCYTLKELRLNNMGLGITGAQMLSNALLDCCGKSEENGNPLKLKVFIAGRNRLEDEGIKTLSEVFRKMESLEELSIPQNGIYKSGIKALSDAICFNTGLKKLNLNDNTLGEEGAKSLANGLRNVRDLRYLDIGDCLIRTNGALAIAELLTHAHNIEEVVLSFNSIRVNGALAVLEALENKKNFFNIKLDGNKFGKAGVDIVKKKALEVGDNKDILDSLEEDEGSDDEEEDCDDAEEDGDYDEEDESESMYVEDDDEPEEISGDEDEGFRNSETEVEERPTFIKNTQLQETDVKEFLSQPTIENLIALGSEAVEKIVDEVKKKSDDISLQIEELISVIMAVSSLQKKAKKQSKEACQLLDEYKVTLECSHLLYAELFKLSKQCDKLSTVNNMLPVFLGLIKGEKKHSTRYNEVFNQESCISVIKEAMQRDYFPEETSKLLKFILSEPHLMKKIQKGN